MGISIGDLWEHFLCPRNSKGLKKHTKWNKSKNAESFLWGVGLGVGR